MSVAAFCLEMEQRGVVFSLSPDGERVALEGDASALDAQVLASVRELKPDIIALLRARDDEPMRRAMQQVNAGPCRRWAEADKRELATQIVALGLSGENDDDNEARVLAAHFCGHTTNGYAVTTPKPKAPPETKN
jgi:hypothetical protein